MKISPTKLILATSVFFVLFDNLTFARHVLEIFPLTLINSGFLISLFAGLTAVITAVFSLVSSKYTLKPLLIFFLLVSAGAAYFMDNYNVVIDHIMIQNMVQTNAAESLDLLSPKLLKYIVLLGLLPGALVWLIPVQEQTFRQSFFRRLRNVMLSLLFLVTMVLCFSRFYTSFFREHKPLRYYTNPTYYIYSTGKYFSKIFHKNNEPLKSVGKDAKVVEKDPEDKRRELVILVVGEAARADHFSLNGYTRETNPLLKKEHLINFPNMFSCGTSTAYSVPCMFSVYGRSSYNDKRGRTTENILDVLNHTGEVSILWRDNNSDSKGVALRVPYENFRDPAVNPICTEGECRDIGMLAGLDSYIAEHAGEDILIVLHQMGNHGPAYYKRYPKAFEKFTPICPTNELEECTPDEINNTYDNALLYTDFFLSKTIDFLKNYDDTHETAMMYMSDHGESLGELGVYLHGLPYTIAPDAQTHIGGFLWLGKNLISDEERSRVKNHADAELSHDTLFHTLLGIFEVQTSVYDKNQDILNPSFSPQ